MTDTVIFECGICGAPARCKIFADGVALGFCDNGHVVRAVKHSDDIVSLGKLLAAEKHQHE
jgi:hypothetical protein